MTRAELVQEVIDRGYDYVSSARIGRFIDRAYQVICSRYPWPFLEATTSGSGTVAISDLRRILSVIDTTHERSLPPVDRRWLAATYTDLTTTGTPAYWYLEENTLKTYPVSADTIEVRYLKRPANLGESDSPLIPADFQYLIVDRAIVDCLRDDDEYDEARALRVDVEEGLREMVHALLVRNYQAPMTVVRTGRWSDYL